MFYLLNVFNIVRARLWLLPSLMSCAAVGLAWLMLHPRWQPVATPDNPRWWLFGGDPDTARGLLSSLLSGLITMTGLVVSITVVVLSLAAAQLGPRVIVNYMRDLQIQSVLGLFIGSILYTLLILRSITGALGEDGVRHLAVSLASGLAMLCLGALLFYVHKVARSIIADTVVHAIAVELETAICASVPEDVPLGRERAEGYGACRTAHGLGTPGYVQVIDYRRLAGLAAECHAKLEVNVRPGQFVLAGGEHLIITSPNKISDDVVAGMRGAFTIGQERTPTQDVEYPIRQLVEIAVRALSSGINDPYTALAVIDRLASALEKASMTPDPQRSFFDGEGTLRVVARRSDFDGLVDAAFDQIRQAAEGNAAVLIGLVQALADLAMSMPVDRLASVETCAAKVERAAKRSLLEPLDLQDCLKRLELLKDRTAHRQGDRPDLVEQSA